MSLFSFDNMNVPEIVQQVLASNEKNISDLISKELSVILFADFIYRNPHLERSISVLYQDVYKKTVLNLTQMFEDLLEQQEKEVTQEEQSQVKQYVQWFVNDLIKEYQEEVQDKVRWLKQQGANQE